MKISTRALYCLRLMVYLADHADRQTPITLKEIAAAREMPYRYLEQLVIALKTAGLLTSVQGKRGGYVLARGGGEITALDVIEATSGPVSLLKCVQDTSDCSCNLSEVCPSRRMWREATSSITEVLGRYTLEDLSERDLLRAISGTSPDEVLAPRCEEQDR